jgi:hypothetical protein
MSQWREPFIFVTQDIFELSMRNVRLLDERVGQEVTLDHILMWVKNRHGLTTYQS